MGHKHQKQVGMATECDSFPWIVDKSKGECGVNTRSRLAW